MQSPRFLTILTMIICALLVFLVAQTRVHIDARGIRLETNMTGSIVRGRGLEIIDDQGRTRAGIQIFPSSVLPDGTTYPEAVLLRLGSSLGRPNVKIAAPEDGSALLLGGESDPTLIDMPARGATTSLHLRNKDGREQLIKP
jgi:hypothetical protein